MTAWGRKRCEETKMDELKQGLIGAGLALLLLILLGILLRCV